MVAAHLVVSFWRTLVLAVVVAALGTYIYIVERPRVASEAAGDTLVKLQTKDVRAVTLRYRDTPVIRIERDGDAWRLREPIDFPADGAVVDRLLDQITETKVERRIKAADAEPLATYGLEGDGHQARVSLEVVSGTKPPDIVVGRTTPVGYSAFARLDGVDEIVVTPLLFHTGIKKSVLELRKKRLFEVDPTQVIAMHIGEGTHDVEIERRGDDWMIKSPVETRADPEQARALAAALNDIEAMDFFDTLHADADADVVGSGGLRFRATLAEAGDVGFRLGKHIEGAPPGYYLVRDGDGLVAKVEEAVQVRFAKDVSALRDKRLYACAADDVGEIRFERADGGSFALSEKDGKWTVTPAEGTAAVRDNVVRRTVGGLVTLAGQDVAAENAAAGDLAAFGLDAPIVEAEVLKHDGSSCGRALAGVKDPTSETPAYYVKRSDNGLVMTLPTYLYSRFDVRRDDMVESKPPPPADAPAATPLN